MKLKVLLTFAALLASTSGAAFSQAAMQPNHTSPPARQFESLDQTGFDKLASSRPDLVHLYTSGNDCKNPSGLNVLDGDLASPLSQMKSSACTMAQMLQEAGVASEEIAAARIRFLHAADEDILRSFVNDNPLASNQVWILEKTDNLPTMSPYMRFSFEVLAYSPDSEAKLRTLR